MAISPRRPLYLVDSVKFSRYSAVYEGTAFFLHYLRAKRASTGEIDGKLRFVTHGECDTRKDGDTSKASEYCYTSNVM